jgi:hypothetical protein
LVPRVLCAIPSVMPGCIYKVQTILSTKVHDTLYPVDHPDFIWLTRGGRTLYISLPGGEGERVRILNTSLIDWLETKEARQPV